MNQTTKSGEGMSLICGIGRTPTTRKEVEKWCARTGNAKTNRVVRAA